MKYPDSGSTMVTGKLVYFPVGRYVIYPNRDKYLADYLSVQVLTGHQVRRDALD